MMEALRTSLHLALALVIVSLTCGLGALCAGMGEECCCMVEDGGSPCTEISGSDDAPAAPEPASTLASSDRFSVAVVDPSPLAPSPGTFASLQDGRASQASPAAATPLYLSHCAFLC